MKRMMMMYGQVVRLLEHAGTWLPQIALRLLLAWEFWESGVMKFKGQNWFADIQGQFPFPFDIIPVDASWFLATWFELAGAVALVIGLGTRFFSFSLVILTIVAWAAVHAGNGYNICSNGYKLPLMFVVLFLPLLFNGAGKASVDYLLARHRTTPSSA